MDVKLFVETIFDAIGTGSLYALFALGIALIFGVMRLINFAHGELIMIGAYALLYVTDQPWPVIVAATVGMTVVFALTMERVAFRPVRGANPATLLITSFAVSYVLQNLAALVFGALPKTADLSPVFLEAFTVGGYTIPKRSVITLVVTLVLLILLAAFLFKTRLGLQMRAAAEDFTMARLVGVRANTVIATSFAISGALAGVASILFVAQTGVVTPSMGSFPVLVAFMATVLGGMGSLPGAVVGGFILGGLTVFLQTYLPIELSYYRDAFVYATVIALFLIRPQGLIVARGQAAPRA
jgi:branched-chain amino acid transport system permease protein